LAVIVNFPTGVAVSAADAGAASARAPANVAASSVRILLICHLFLPMTGKLLEAIAVPGAPPLKQAGRRRLRCFEWASPL